MPYDLTAIAKRTRRTKKKSATFRDIPPSTALASDLLTSCYLPVVNAWTAAIPAIMEQYERTLADLTTDAPADVQAEISKVEASFDRLFITIRPLLERLILRVETWHRGKWRGAALSVTGVDVGTLIGPEAVRTTMGLAIERNVGLIKDISAQARNRIADSVFRGLQQRRPARDVAREVREATGMARDRSVRVASDQLAKITEALSDERRREAGLDKWEWKWSGKQNGREEHIARDGKVYSDADLPPDMPGELPFCGCRSLSVIEFEAVEPAQPAKAKPAPVETVEARAPRTGFTSPVNPDVTDATVMVRSRALVQKDLTERLAKSASHPAYSPEPEYRSIKKQDFGRASLSSQFDNETASMIDAIMPELDNLSAQLGLPLIRGIRTTTRVGANASMGDGVLSINPVDFNARANLIGNRSSDAKIASILREKASIKSQLDAHLGELKAIESELKSFGNWRTDPRSAPLIKRHQETIKSHNSLRLKYKKVANQEAREARHAEPVSKWKPGDNVAERPFSVASYQTGMNKARSTLYHEFAHHIHQMLDKKGPLRQFGSPPLERELQEHYRRAMRENADGQPSKYATTNQFEWFAENFAAYAMGRKDLVDKIALKLIERVFNGGD